MANAKRDGNHVPTLTGVSNVDNETPVNIWADPTTHELLVSGASGSGGDGAIVDGVSAAIKATVFDYTGSNPIAVRLTDTAGDYIAAGAGTQYTEGDTDASITGTAMMMEGAGNALVAAPGTAADGLLVNLGTNNDVTNTGTFAVQDATAQASLSVMDDWDNGASDGASVSGDVAHDSADAGEPVKIGFRAFSPDGTTPGTAVAENDRTNAKGDLDGRFFVNDEHPRWWSYHLNTSTAQTDTTVQAAPGAGFQIVITYIQFSLGAATAINMFLEEGASTIWGPIYLEAINGRGYVTPYGFKKHVTVNTALTLTTSASVAHSVEILGYIQAV